MGGPKTFFNLLLNNGSHCLSGNEGGVNLQFVTLLRYLSVVYFFCVYLLELLTLSNDSAVMLCQLNKCKYCQQWNLLDKLCNDGTENLTQELPQFDLYSVITKCSFTVFGSDSRDRQ